MGIRFYCPNGHRLNVKNFLAGRRGICPSCDARFRIPLESQISANAPRARPGNEAPERSYSGVAVTATAAALMASGESAVTDCEPPRTMNDVSYRPGSPAAKVSPPAAVSPVAVLPAGASPPATSPAATSPAVTSPAVTSPAVTSPAVGEGGEGVWYVRPPTGGQYGPAQDELFRGWMEEGRVSADSLVWREGWSDWQTASDVFPELVGGGRVSGEAIGHRASRGEESRRPSSARIAGAPTRRKPIAAVVFLGLATLALLAVLLVVLQTR
jgi:hypothetical protein